MMTEYSESETVELKSVFADDIKKEIAAFANTRGGTIYVGIDDDGTVRGVDNPDRTIQQITNAARDAIRPDVTMLLYYETIAAKDRRIVAVKVSCGAHRPYYLAAKGLRPEGVYIRQDTSSVPASDAAIRRMIRETDGDNYEEMRSLEQNLTFEKASAEFARRGLAFGEIRMKTLGMMDSDGIFTNLALLLSDQCPHIIKAASFAGTDQSDFQDRREFGGSLLKQLEDAYAYLDLRNQTRATFEGLLRIDHRDYPGTAIRESLVNAIVHRDYSVAASTLLSVYADRMEMISVGGLAGGMTFEDMMLGVSYCRNRRLADVFYRLSLIEAYGTGMKKILSSYREAPIKPEIHTTSGAFKTVLPNLNTSNVLQRRGRKEQAVLDLFRDKTSLTRAEIGLSLGMSTSDACRVIRKLIESGDLVSEGKGKNVKYFLRDVSGRNAF